MTRAEVANTIEQFLDGNGGQWDWDDFCSCQIADPELDAIRGRCVNLHDEYPSETGYCSTAGFQLMREMVRTLRTS
jgi:hypothetical protein